MPIAVCAIAKDEELYIDEWIAHNLAVGFDKVFIFDNSPGCDLRHKQSARVHVQHFPGPTKQLPAYQFFLQAYGKMYDWVAFLDVDEFIVLRPPLRTVKALVDSYATGASALALNWYMFGSNGHKEYAPLPVVKRFTRRAGPPDAHVKILARPREVLAIEGPHHARTTRGTKDTNGRLVHGPHNIDGPTNVACIHHYFTKSEAEFRKKIERGRADQTVKRTFDEFFAADRNDVEDLSLAK